MGETASAVGAAVIVFITIIIPPVGVFLVTGCGPDFLVNLILTICGWIPGWFHAFYIEYIYIERRLQASHGMLEAERAPFIFSKRVQTGGRKLMAMQPLPPLMQPQLGAKSQAQPQPVLQATVPTTAGVVSMAVE